MVLRCLFLQKFVSLHKIGGTSAIKRAYGVRLALSLHKIRLRSAKHVSKLNDFVLAGTIFA